MKKYNRIFVKMWGVYSLLWGTVTQIYVQVIEVNTNTYMSPGCLLYQPEARIPNLKAQNVLHNCNKGIRTIQTLYGNIYLHCSPPPHLAPGSKVLPLKTHWAIQNNNFFCWTCSVQHIGQLEITKNIPVRNEQSCIYYLKHTNKLCMWTIQFTLALTSCSCWGPNLLDHSGPLLAYWWSTSLMSSASFWLPSDSWLWSTQQECKY